MVCSILLCGHGTNIIFPPGSTSTFTYSADEVEFSLDLSRSLLAMVDRDLSGGVDYYEFEPLVFSLRRWVVR